MCQLDFVSTGVLNFPYHDLLCTNDNLEIIGFICTQFKYAIIEKVRLIPLLRDPENDDYKKQKPWASSSASASRPKSKSSSSDIGSAPKTK